MEGIRKEISEFLRWGGVILYGSAMEKPLNEDELKLLETYVMRICQKFNFSPQPSDTNAGEQSPNINGNEPYRITPREASQPDSRKAIA